MFLSSCACSEQQHSTFSPLIRLTMCRRHRGCFFSWRVRKHSPRHQKGDVLTLWDEMLCQSDRRQHGVSHVGLHQCDTLRGKSLGVASRDHPALAEMPLLLAKVTGSGEGLCSCDDGVFALELCWILWHVVALRGEASFSPNKHGCPLASWHPTPQDAPW